ncbi:hypothetical protein D3C87_80190 [compost metagenome]
MSDIDKFYSLKNDKKEKQKLQNLFKRGVLPSDIFRNNIYEKIDGNYYKSLLDEVSECESSSLLRILLKNSQGITLEEYLSALQYAVVHGNIGTTRVLLKYGVIPNKFIVQCAIANCELRIFELLIQYVDFNKMKKSLEKEVDKTLKMYNFAEGDKMIKLNARHIRNINKLNEKYF